jgi:hypothetical protein
MDAPDPGASLRVLAPFTVLSDPFRPRVYRVLAGYN